MNYADILFISFKQAGKELHEAVARFIFENANRQLVDALSALGVAAAVKQHALQGFNDAGVCLGLHDDGAVDAMAPQIRVSVIVLVSIDPIGAVGADFVDDAADAHDSVGVVVHLENEQRRFIRDAGLDWNGTFVNAGMLWIGSEPRRSLGPCCVAVPRDAHGYCC